LPLDGTGLAVTFTKAALKSSWCRPSATRRRARSAPQPKGAPKGTAQTPKPHPSGAAINVGRQAGRAGRTDVEDAVGELRRRM